MAEDRIEMKIDVDAGDAVRKTGEVARSVENLGESTKKAGDAAQGSTSMWGKFGSAISSFGGQVAGAVTLIGTAVAAMRTLATVARESAQAVVDAGRQLAGLSGNIGGRAAVDVFHEATRVAGEQGIGTSGRSELVEAVGTMTDLRPGASREDRSSFISAMASLKRATGQGGRGAAQAVLALEGNQRLGFNRDQAVTAAATLMSGGMSAEVIEALSSRSGAVGRDFLATAFAAREHGLPLGTAGRSLGSLIDAVTRTDQGGGVAPDLAAMGITPDMDATARIRQIASAMQDGAPMQQVEAAIGGTSNLRLFLPMAEAIRTGGGERASKALTDPRTMARMIAEQEQNPYVQAMRREENRQLAAQAEREASMLGGLGERLSQQESELATSINPLKGFVGTQLLRAAVSSTTAGGVSDDAANLARIQAATGGHITINTGTVIQGDAPAHAPSGRLDP